MAGADFFFDIVPLLSIRFSLPGVTSGFGFDNSGIQAISRLPNGCGSRKFHGPGESITSTHLLNNVKQPLRPLPGSRVNDALTFWTASPRISGENAQVPFLAVRSGLTVSTLVRSRALTGRGLIRAQRARSSPAPPPGRRRSRRSGSHPPQSCLRLRTRSSWNRREELGVYDRIRHLLLGIERRQAGA
jgi:hypothetical protein